MFASLFEGSVKVLSGVAKFASKYVSEKIIKNIVSRKLQRFEFYDLENYKDLRKTSYLENYKSFYQIFVVFEIRRFL